MSSKSPFQIALDRPSGVYHAGEVVRGTVTITPDFNEKCRSIQLEMAGKALVHWFISSSNSRTPCDGRKTFLHHGRTLIGNHFKTAVLDYAEEDATFGDADGDGDLYIPVPNDSNDMRIIVQVCYYDFMKRKEQTMGEVIIDARDLASRRHSITFPFRCQKKGSVTLAAKFIRNPPETMYSTQTNEILVLNVLKAKGLCQKKFNKRFNVFAHAWRAPTNFQPGANDTLPNSTQVSLRSGSTQFKFAFPTRADSPGSVALDVDYYAYIGYYIIATLDKNKWSNNPTLKVPIIILPSFPVPMPQLLTPTDSRVGPTPLNEFSFCCFKCGAAGNVELKLSLPRRAFAPGEMIDLSGSEVINDSTIPVQARVHVRQLIKLTSQNTLSPLFRDETRFFELDSILVKSQTTSNLGSLNVTVPALPPTFFGARGFTARNKAVEPLKFCYELSLEVEAKSGHKEKIGVPILISASPPKVEPIRDKSQFRANRIVDPFEIQRFTICGDAPCASEAKSVQDAGTIVPAITGAGHLWDIDQDERAAMKAYPFQPQVVLFSSDS